MAALRALPAVVWAALIFWLSSRSKLPEVPFPIPGLDKLAHAFAYGVLALLVLLAQPKGRRRLEVAVVVAALYGATDEWHQAYVPGRSTDVLDWLADLSGALLAASSWTVARARARRDHSRDHAKEQGR